MEVIEEVEEATHVTAPVASSALSVNVFTAPGKTVVGERTKPFGEPLGFDPITSTLIFGEYDVVLVDAMGTIAGLPVVSAESPETPSQPDARALSNLDLRIRDIDIDSNSRNRIDCLPKV